VTRRLCRRWVSQRLRMGRNSLEFGYSVDQVVHDYGDLCQAIADLAAERDAPFSIDEFRTLNRCLDNAIADAVTEYSVLRDATLARQQAAEVNERLGFLVHELRNSVSTVRLAVSALERGNLPMSGATGGVLKRSLDALATLVDGTLNEVRVKADATAQSTPFSLAMFMADAESEAALDASERGCVLTVIWVLQDTATACWQRWRTCCATPSSSPTHTPRSRC
jgi:signal transduction histidine kinase